MFELLLGLVIGWVCRWIYGIITTVYRSESISPPGGSARTYREPTPRRERTPRKEVSYHRESPSPRIVIEEPAPKMIAEEPVPEIIPVEDDAPRKDAIEVLTTLGFKRGEAKKTVNAIQISEPTTENLVKKALVMLKGYES